MRTLVQNPFRFASLEVETVRRKKPPPIYTKVESEMIGPIPGTPCVERPGPFSDQMTRPVCPCKQCFHCRKVDPADSPARGQLRYKAKPWTCSANGRAPWLCTHMAANKTPAVNWTPRQIARCITVPLSIAEIHSSRHTPAFKVREVSGRTRYTPPTFAGLAATTLPNPPTWRAVGTAPPGFAMKKVAFVVAPFLKTSVTAV